MTTLQKISSGIVVLLLAIAALAAQFITVPQRAYEQGAYTANSGELTRDVLVGQTFVSQRENLSGVAVQFATYANRRNTAPVYFYLRSSLASRENIRTVTVSPDKLKDNQSYRFNFTPVADSKDKTYFFFVVSPESASGNAVTVDIDSRDPYVGGTAFLVRGQGSAVTDPAVLERSGKPNVDVTFATYHQVPLRQAVVDAATGSIRYLVQTWPEKKGLYQTWVYMDILVALFIIVWIAVPWRGLKKDSSTFWLVTFLCVAALATRYLYALNLPLTADEGNYLYDAASAARGHLAGGDGYVKSPLVILWIMVWQALFTGTPLLARVSSLVIGALTIWPLYIIGRELWGKRTGVFIAAIWAFFGAAIVFNVYVHTQPLALFFGVSGLATLLMALRGTTPRLTFLTQRRAPSALGWFFFAGMLLGFGVASRKSILAVGLVPLLLIAVEGKGWKARWRQLVAVAVGFGLVLAIFFGAAYFVYGLQGIKEAAGINSAEDGYNANDPSQVEQVREYSIHGLTPLFRESLPLIFLSLIGWGITLERWLRHLLGRVRLSSARTFAWLEKWAAKIIWLAPLAVFYWAWTFFFEYEGAIFMGLDIIWLWYSFGALLFIIALWPRSAEEKITLAENPIVTKSLQPNVVIPYAAPSSAQEHPLRRLTTASFLVALWLFGLAFFYMQWIKFHANYLAEFIPPLVVLSGAGASLLWSRFSIKSPSYLVWVQRAVVVAVVLTVIWAVFVSNYITYTHPHTGTFDQRESAAAAAWAKENIPADQPIFTGAALIPYLSGHHTALDIAHPRWYAYDFTRSDLARMQAFLPAVTDMRRAFYASSWVLMDQQTGFSFVMEYSDIEAAIANDFVAVKTFENGSNTLTFYKRIR